jgi:hypothetical protein
MAMMNSSDPVIVAFVRFLERLILEGTSIEEIERFVELFTKSYKGSAATRSQNTLGPLQLFTFIREMQDIDNRKALVLEKVLDATSKKSPLHIRPEVGRQLVELQRETNRILRHFLKQRSRRLDSAFQTREVVSKPESVRVRPSMKMLPPHEEPSAEDRGIQGQSSDSGLRVIPAPVILLAIRDMIRSAEESILVQASSRWLPKSILAEMEKRAEDGLDVRWITDGGYSVSNGVEKRLNVIPINKIPLTLFVKDQWESLSVLRIDTPEKSIGIKLFLPERARAVRDKCKEE